MIYLRIMLFILGTYLMYVGIEYLDYVKKAQHNNVAIVAVVFGVLALGLSLIKKEDLK